MCFDGSGYFSIGVHRIFGEILSCGRVVFDFSTLDQGHPGGHLEPPY